MTPRPCSPSEAVSRAQALLVHPSNAEMGYLLGAGDYLPGAAIDLPWTPGSDGHGMGADCRVAFLWCYKVPAKRVSYNMGDWATVEDCVNYNSLLEDAEHWQDLVVPVTDDPQLGDILAYPTIHLPGHPLPWIGHGAIVVGVDRWDGSTWASLDIMQVCGPPNRKPAAIASDGHVFDKHTADWPKDEHRSKLLRVVP